MPGREAPVNPENFLVVQRHLADGRTLDIGSGEVHPHADVTLDADPDVDPDVQADLRQGIPFADDAFETVTAIHVLEHLADDVGLWTEMQRVSSERALAMVPIGHRDDPDHEHVYGSPAEIAERFEPTMTATSRWGSKFDLLFGVDL